MPDFTTTEGKAAVGGYSFAFLTFARTIVPLRIAFALALTPWVNDNIMSRFKSDDDDDDGPSNGVVAADANIEINSPEKEGEKFEFSAFEWPMSMRILFAPYLNKRINIS